MAILVAVIPSNRQPIVYQDGKGIVTREWWRFFTQLQEIANGTVGPGDGLLFLSGTNPPSWVRVTDAALLLSDITTNDVTTLMHGFAPKAPGDPTKFLDGTGAYSVPSGSGSGSAGLMGPPGFDGDDGLDGIGLPGPMGPQGLMGLSIPGMDGADGLDGIGLIGPTGATGATGATGVTGAMGVPGFDGDDGLDGVPLSAQGGSGTATRYGVVGIVIDGGGYVITTGVKGFVQVPVACTILSWTLLSIDASALAGNITIDIWKDIYANYPPTVLDTITASAKPALSGVNANTSSTLTGWTITVNAGDVIGFNVDTATTVQKVLLQLAVSVP